jgi:predicted dehydrogenase
MLVDRLSSTHYALVAGPEHALPVEAHPGVRTPVACGSGVSTARVPDEAGSQTPDTLEVSYEYQNPSFVLVYEHRWNNANSMYGKGHGIQFHGTDGTLFVDRSGFELFPETRGRDGKQVGLAPDMKMSSINDSGLGHVRNFLDCVKSRVAHTLFFMYASQLLARSVKGIRSIARVDLSFGL